MTVEQDGNSIRIGFKGVVIRPTLDEAGDMADLIDQILLDAYISKDPFPQDEPFPPEKL